MFAISVTINENLWLHDLWKDICKAVKYQMIDLENEG